MTGLDCLREEMIARGCTTQQINSKVVTIVLEILAQDVNHFATSQYEYEQSVNAMQSRYDNLYSQYIRLETDLKNRQMQLQSAQEEIKSIKEEEWKREVEYVEHFNASLMECETPEGRDATRKCQMFINSIDVDSKYDNTAKIISLGAILSNGSIAPVDELRKINPKLFRDRHGTIRRDTYTNRKAYWEWE